MPEFNRTDADVSLIFFAPNSIGYLAPVEDLWFEATIPFNISVGTTYETLYYPNYLVNVMGCTDQFQICNPSTECTPLGSKFQLTEYLNENAIGLNAEQMASARRMETFSSYCDTYSTVDNLGDTALYARDYIQGTISQGMPSNQWHTEVEGWFQTNLAKMQAYAIEYAANKKDLGPYGYIYHPNPDLPIDAPWVHQCKNQRIRNSGSYQSFSVLGLVVLLVIGGILIILSLILEPAVRLLRRFTGSGPHREAARIADRKLQLQRMIFEEGGHGVWEKEMDDVPVMRGRNVRLPVPVRVGDSMVYQPVPPLRQAHAAYNGAEGGAVVEVAGSDGDTESAGKEGAVGGRGVQVRERETQGLMSPY